MVVLMPLAKVLVAAWGLFTVGCDGRREASGVRDYAYPEALKEEVRDGRPALV